jgi:hypothetical protein
MIEVLEGVLALQFDQRTPLSREVPIGWWPPPRPCGRTRWRWSGARWRTHPGGIIAVLSTRPSENSESLWGCAFI